MSLEKKKELAKFKLQLAFFIMIIVIGFLTMVYIIPNYALPYSNHNGVFMAASIFGFVACGVIILVGGIESYRVIEEYIDEKYKGENLK